jgi:hypothetical protein
MPMPRLSPETVALRTLRGEQVPARCRITREQAQDLLRRITGQDFGEDADKWTAYLRVLPRDGQNDDESTDRIGVLKRMDPGATALVECEDGSLVQAIIPRTAMRRMGFLKIGVSVLVRHRSFGCSQIIGIASQK